tara:strand:- start:2826 stop:3161 length:336 start_codon:yes stop_codon:yes gene_type:complete
LSRDFTGEWMKPEDIDSEGNWLRKGERIPLLGSTIPVPEHVRKESGGDEYQEVIMITPANNHFDKCPQCHETLPESTVVLVTNYAMLMATKCCDWMLWMKNERENYGNEYA